MTLSTATQKSLDRKKYMKYVQLSLWVGRVGGRSSREGVGDIGNSEEKFME